MNSIVEPKLIDLCEQFNASECFTFFIFNTPLISSKSANKSVCLPISSIVSSHALVEEKISSQYIHDSKLLSVKSKDPLDVDDMVISINKAYSSMSESVLSIEFRLLIAKKISIKFLFFSNEGFNESLISNKALLNAKLLNIALSLNAEHKLITLMLLDSGVISRKVFNIVNLVAQGTSREDIAEKMKLSVRGVDYYIEVSKQVFEAKSMPEIVYAASQYGLLTGEFALELDDEDQ
ncbi:hypothetical protein [Shewanella sp. KT0246]|uniref:helix-turn-helix transcriptional regulator n=1 Tax=Shewanella sp. KT0246 TaxID=2815912 RepID=UPI001BC3927F|nr:hypothetical protein [Shewanella sp. KT0246]GIU48521.1 hypothetical protein TUM4249_04020 [Shewanella sp. KT0246]